MSSCWWVLGPPQYQSGLAAWPSEPKPPFFFPCKYFHLIYLVRLHPHHSAKQQLQRLVSPNSGHPEASTISQEQLGPGERGLRGSPSFFNQRPAVKSQQPVPNSGNAKHAACWPSARSVFKLPGFVVLRLWHRPSLPGPCREVKLISLATTAPEHGALALSPQKSPSSTIQFLSHFFSSAWDRGLVSQSCFAAVLVQSCVNSQQFRRQQAQR